MSDNLRGGFLTHTVHVVLHRCDRASTSVTTVPGPGQDGRNCTNKIIRHDTIVPTYFGTGSRSVKAVQ